MNSRYLAGLPSDKMTMSIAGGQKTNTNPIYLAGLSLGKMTMSIAGGQTSKHTNMCYSVNTMNLITCYTHAEKSSTGKFSCICNEHISIKIKYFSFTNVLMLW